ncbi:MAG: DUF1801 domain-containing protein [Cyclobacteriaceae bacterium]|nr:DUF1801 domain-containing protein [Cyclobacteriaceae bacterium]
MALRSAAVDDFLNQVKEPHRTTMEALRDIVFQLVSGVEEQLKWNCPFYSRHGLLCYINLEKKTSKVALCFVEGFLLDDKHGLLSTGTKQIRKLYIPDHEDINLRVVRYYLNQAIKINQGKEKNFMNVHKSRGARRTLFSLMSTCLKF